jgi:hypothetical protein
MAIVMYSSIVIIIFMAMYMRIRPLGYMYHIRIIKEESLWQIQ